MSPQDHELSDLSGSAGLYALDALEGDERQRFESLLASNPMLQAEVADYRATAARLAEVAAANPSSSLRDRVMAEVSETRQDAPVVSIDTRRDVSASRRVMRLVAAAAVVLLAAVGGYALNGSGSVPPSSLANLLAQPDSQVLNLVSSSDGSTAGRVVMASSTQQLVVVSDQLRPLPRGRIYELWKLNDNGPSKAGLFAPGPEGTVEFAAQVGLQDATGFAITEEPEGGSDQPTTPILVTAQLN